MEEKIKIINIEKNISDGKSYHGFSLTKQATSDLRNRILDLSLCPGEHLDEKMLLKKFPFGRTPIREALNRLIAEGLVKTKNTRGTYVASMNISDTLQLLDAYVISERVISTFADLSQESLLNDLKIFQNEYEKVCLKPDLLLITEINSKFHNRIAKSTNNQFLISHSAHLHNLSRRLSYFVYKFESQSQVKLVKHLKKINKDHQEIINQVEFRNQNKLVKLCTEHAEMFRKRLQKVINRNGIKKLDLMEIQLK